MEKYETLDQSRYSATVLTTKVYKETLSVTSRKKWKLKPITYYTKLAEKAIKTENIHLCFTDLETVLIELKGRRVMEKFKGEKSSKKFKTCTKSLLVNTESYAIIKKLKVS